MNKSKFCALILTIVMALGLPVAASAQSTISLTGSVVDAETDEPLVGASVIVKGQQSGTQTDIDGRFEIKVPKNGTIAVSYVGYQKQDIKVGSQTNIDVRLQSVDNMLDELVVIGYGVQRKSDITGSISSIAGKDINDTPVASALQALQGRASGVNIVQNTGQPGSAVTIKIRGAGTINDSDPLYIVDGFIVDDITHLNPNDIENVEVFKDAASSAVYGARAANGVVSVTTKSGKEGKARVTFDMFAGFANPWKTIDVMGLEDYALLYDYYTDSNLYSERGQLAMKHDSEGNLIYSPERFSALDTIARNTMPNWWDAVTRTGVKQSYSLSVSGGTQKTKYMVSGSFYKEDGIVKKSDYQRFNVRMNLNQQLFSWLDMNANMSYSREDRQMVPEGSGSILKSALRQNPLTYLYNLKDYWASNHVMAVLDRWHQTNVKNRMDMNLGLTARFLKYFNYQFKVSYYYIPTETKQFTEVARMDEDFVMPTDLTTLTQNIGHTSKWELNNILTFKWNNKVHDLTVMAGQTAEGYKYVYQSGVRKGASSNDATQHFFNSAYTGDKVTGYDSQWTAVGFVGRIAYNLLDRYLIQANMRIDGSSKFTKGNQWGYFPSISVGWRFNNEAFLRDAEWLNMGKIRVGYGILGNNRISEYARFTYLSSLLNYSYGVGNQNTHPGYAALMLGNPDIKWEKTKTFNVGIDLGFWQNRLTFSAEYFDKVTEDMLLEVPTVASAGLNSNPMTNAGNVSNRGVEFTVNHQNSIGEWRYEIGFNLSYIKNKVVSLGTGNEPVWGGYLSEGSIIDYVTKTEVGRPIGSFYGYVTDGIFQSVEEVGNSAQYDGGKNLVNQTAQPGDFRFVDINGDGKITPEDRTYLGSPLPDFVFGIPMMAGWRNFDLNLFWQGQTGNKVFNVMEYYLNNPVTGNVYADLRERHWAGGDMIESRSFWPANPDGTVPDPGAGDSNRNFRASDFYVKDGSYIRLKELRLTYTLPRKLVNHWRMDNIAVSITGYNLLTFTRYNGLDPEVGRLIGTEGNNLNMGLDHGTYPQARSFTFGLKVTI